MGKAGAQNDGINGLLDPVNAEAKAYVERYRAKKSGGKLNRSETVTVRFDPRLNYLCELAARTQRRTKSSFIEWAVEQSLIATAVPGSEGFRGETKSISEFGPKLWDVDEPDRLANLAYDAPLLMTHDEQVIWKAIQAYGFLWSGTWEERQGQEVWTWNPDNRHNLLRDRLRDRFEAVRSRLEEGAPLTDLPDWNLTRPLQTEMDPDSDVTF
jgi:hypothetical protein